MERMNGQAAGEMAVMTRTQIVRFGELAWSEMTLCGAESPHLSVALSMAEDSD